MDSNKTPSIPRVLKKQAIWENLWFYQKSVVLYQMTYVFTGRFLPRYGDRTAEEMANIALTLCHIVDKMMLTYQTNKEKSFVTEGGIRERMTAARMGYRNQQKETIEELKKENARLMKCQICNP